MFEDFDNSGIICNFAAYMVSPCSSGGNNGVIPEEI